MPLVCFCPLNHWDNLTCCVYSLLTLLSSSGVNRVGILTRVVERALSAQIASTNTPFLMDGLRRLNPSEDRLDPTAGTG